MRVCKVKGCERTDIRARGWCRKHYTRWWRHNNPTFTKHPQYEYPSGYFLYFSPSMAYILGLLMADGSVMEKEGISCRLVFYSKDIELVGFIKEELSDCRPSKKTKRDGLYYLSISSKVLANELALYGIVPRKTFKTYYPEIPPEYDADFIRGLFDGDGSVFPTNKGRSLAFVWMGTSELLTSIVERLSHHLDIRHRKLQSTQSRAWKLRYEARRDIERIFCFLYSKDCCMWLDRKFSRAEQFFREIHHSEVVATRGALGFPMSTPSAQGTPTLGGL